MTPLRDEELKQSLKKLDGQLRVKAVHYEQLRDRILLDSTPVKKSKQKPMRNRTFLAVAMALLLLFGISPFYSHTMASLVERIIPLKITPNEPTAVEELQTEILQLAIDTSYPVSSVGTTPDPFTVHIEFVEGDIPLSKLEQAIKPAVHQLLVEKGIDQYELDIKTVEVEENYTTKVSDEMDAIAPIISEAFQKYEYTDLAEHATYGIKGGFFSNTLELDMPDHVQEAEQIKEFIAAAIDREELDIKKIDLFYYNQEHRNQEDRWAFLSNKIYENLAGKSIYKATGLTYSVKKGVTHVQLKTALPEQSNPQILTEIDTAIRAYLETEEIQDTIRKDGYRIQLINEEETVLLEVTNRKN